MMRWSDQWVSANVAGFVPKRIIRDGLCEPRQNLAVLVLTDMTRLDIADNVQF